MIDRRLEFPSDFVWGSATAAHQVEGDNRHNDWWAHELASNTNAIEPSGIACDHYHRFADDFRLCKSLGHGAHRMSIEWSRIEPSEGQIDRAEIEHYRKVLTTLREVGMEPWVTLHHFTLPMWFAQRGGFSKRENLDAFRRFVELAAREYGDLVSHWCTINEPTVHAELGFRFGYFPPRLQDQALSATVLRNLFRAHAQACEAVKAHAKRTPFIGITLAVQAHEPFRPDSDADRALAARRDAESTAACYEALRT
ncbi:MAG TPA: family 1 glycosylhydrolase, partial [Candidatus Kryptonia bacterium]|nr:family 1 glycosylhydrolase [Candidatus Kryptonia bacterium]